MEKRVEQFREWAKRKGWPSTFVQGNDPRQWKGGLSAVYEIYADGWKDCEAVREKTLVWDD